MKWSFSLLVENLNKRRLLQVYVLVLSQTDRPNTAPGSSMDGWMTHHKHYGFALNLGTFPAS